MHRGGRVCGEAVGGGGGEATGGGVLVRVVDAGCEIGGEDLDIGFLGVALVEELAW